MEAAGDEIYTASFISPTKTRRYIAGSRARARRRTLEMCSLRLRVGGGLAAKPSLQEPCFPPLPASALLGAWRCVALLCDAALLTAWRAFHSVAFVSRYNLPRAGIGGPRRRREIRPQLRPGLCAVGVYSDFYRASRIYRRFPRSPFPIFCVHPLDGPFPPLSLFKVAFASLFPSCFSSCVVLPKPSVKPAVLRPLLFLLLPFSSAALVCSIATYAFSSSACWTCVFFCFLLRREHLRCNSRKRDVSCPLR